MANELRPPDYRELGDELLIALLAESAPCRRSRWVAQTAERESFSVQLQRKLAAHPTGLHPTHIRQRLNRTVDWLSEQGWVTAPSRGLYVLTVEGRGHALKKRREQRAKIARLTERAGSSGPRTKRERVDSARPVGDALPAFVRGARPDELGEPYRGRRRVRTTSPELFSWDADDKDRNTQAHEDVLWLLSTVLADHGIVPRVRHRRPRVDLLFRHNRVVTVVEIKSLPDGGHEHQLRVGLGQILQYRRELQDQHDDAVRALLCVPSRPQRADVWTRACADVGVGLLVAEGDSRVLASRLLDAAVAEPDRPLATPP